MAKTNIEEVVFKPHNTAFTQVTATLEDGTKDVVYLDNQSAKAFLQMALAAGTRMQ